MQIPVDFSKKTKESSKSSTGYPYQISASDLDKNFVYAALDVDKTLIEETSGDGGHTKRKLKIPAMPSSGTYVLGAISGSLSWISTEEC
jgi:hypothetical protein